MSLGNGGFVNSSYGQCECFGCMLPGSISDGIKGGQWFCFVHSGQDVNRWQAITAAIRARESEFSSLLKLRRMSQEDFDGERGAYVRAPIVATRPKLQQKEGESVKAYTTRVQFELRMEVLQQVC